MPKQKKNIYATDLALSMPTDFPSGLIQPEGSYRFGLDALLLAAFASHTLACKPGTLTCADLGSGCGAALIGLALLNEKLWGIGIEREPKLAEAALLNIRNLGLDDRIAIISADIENGSYECLPGVFQMVMANPPWHRPSHGRTPKSALRRRALCQTENTLAAFMTAARRLLAYHGFFCAIAPPALLCDFYAAGSGLGLRRILPVASHAGEDASRLLLLAQKDAAHDPRISPPLILQERGRHGKKWTEQAIAFCPWLKTDF